MRSSAAKLCLVLALTGVYRAGATQAQTQNDGPAILPPRLDAIGGGNPFEGLGRPDDPNPSRVDDTRQDALGNIIQGSDGPPPGPAELGLQIDKTLTPAQLAAIQQAARDAQAEATKNNQGQPARSKRGLLDRPTAGLSSLPQPAAMVAVRELRQGQYHKALESLERLRRQYPQAGEIEYLMGVASVMTQNFGQARLHYARAEQLGPQEVKELARKGLERMRN